MCTPLWKKIFNKYKNTNQEIEIIRKEYLHHKYLLEQKEKAEVKNIEVKTEEKLEPAIIKVEEDHAQRMLEEPVQLI